MEYRFHFLHLAIIIIIHISQLFVYFSLFVYSIFENNYFFSSFVFCSIFLNYYVDLFCHCPISSPFCYLLKITHLTGCSPLGVHSIGHWAHSWVRSIEVERTRSALVKCKCGWCAKKIFYYDKEARGTQRKNVNLCGGWCGGCDENFKYFYPSACGGVNQPFFSCIWTKDLKDCCALARLYVPLGASNLILALPLTRVADNCMITASIVYAEDHPWGVISSMQRAPPSRT